MADQNQQVVISMTAQDAEMVAAWQRAKKNVGEFEAGVTKAGKAGKQAGKDTQSAFESAGLSISSLASTFTGIGSAMDVMTSALNLFKQEVEQIKQAEAGAAKHSLGVNAAFRKAAARLPAGGMSPNELYQGIVGGAGGADVGGLFGAFEAAQSEGESGKAMETVLQIAKLRPDLASDQGTINKLAATAMQVQGQTGATAKQSVGGLLQGASVSNTDSLGQFLDTSVKTALGLQRQAGGKGDFRELVSLVEGFGEAMESPDKAATALPKLFAKMQKQTGQLDVGLPELLASIKADPKQREKIIGAVAQEDFGKSAKTVESEIKSGLLDKIQGEAFSTSVDFLRGGGRVQAEIDKQRAKQLGPTDAAAAAISRTATGAKSVGGNVTDELRKLTEQKQAEFDLLGGRDAKGGSYDLLAKSLTRMGINPLGRTIAEGTSRLAAEFAGGGEIATQSAVSGTIRAQASRVLAGTTEVGDTFITRGDREAAQRELMLADKLDELIRLQVEQLQATKNQRVTIAGDERPTTAAPAPVGLLSD